MKRSNGTLILAVALVSLVCFGLTFAQLGDNDGPDENGKTRRERTRERMFDRLVEKLALTEEQAEELKTMFGDHREVMMELRASLRDVLRSIREELAKDEPDEAVLAGLIAQANAIREQLKTEQEAFKAKIDEFKAGLTVTQQAQFLLFEARMYRRMHRRPGERGKGPRFGDELRPFADK